MATMARLTSLSSVLTHICTDEILHSQVHAGDEDGHFRYRTTASGIPQALLRIMPQRREGENTVRCCFNGRLWPTACAPIGNSGCHPSTRHLCFESDISSSFNEDSHVFARSAAATVRSASWEDGGGGGTWAPEREKGDQKGAGLTSQGALSTPFSG